MPTPTAPLPTLPEVLITGARDPFAWLGVVEEAWRASQAAIGLQMLLQPMATAPEPVRVPGGFMVGDRFVAWSTPAATPATSTSPLPIAEPIVDSTPLPVAEPVPTSEPFPIGVLPEVVIRPPIEPVVTPATVTPGVVLPVSGYAFAPGDFDPALIDLPIPTVTAPPMPPATAAPPLAGASPIGLVGVGTIVLPQELPWWQTLPGLVAAPMMPAPRPTVVPVLPGTGYEPNILPGTPGAAPIVSPVPGLVALPVGVPGVTTAPGLGIGVPATFDAPTAAPASTVAPALPVVAVAPGIGVGVGGLDPFALFDPRIALQPGPESLPLTGIGADVGAPTDTDECECASKKKKPKKRKERTECWGGGYQQRAKGIVYQRRYRVNCATGKRITVSSKLQLPF